MSERILSPHEAHALVEAGYRFIDVRSVVEFIEGHVPGAFNVPLMHPDFDQLEDNPRFLAVIRRHVPSDAPIILGCHSGTRSARARALLEREGYSQVFELGPGWDGRRDAFGRLDPGWRRLGLPVERTPAHGRSYEELDPESSLG